MSKIHKNLLNVNEWLPLFGCFLGYYQWDGHVECFGAPLGVVLVVDVELELHLLLHVIELQWFDLHQHQLLERVQE